MLSFLLHRATLASIATRLALAVVLGGIVLVSPAAAGEGAKTYTLFEGNNIAVGQGKDVYPVRDINGGSWVIVVNGKETLVSAKSRPIAMKVTPISKLSDISVTFENFKTERAYTFMNDPSVRLTRSMGQAALTGAAQQAAVNQAAAAQASGPIVNTPPDAGSPNKGGAMATSGVADQSMRMASGGPGLDLVPNDANNAEGNFDALDVSFEISSATPLTAPYIVTTTRIHEAGSPVGSFRNVVSARALDPVTTKVTKVQYQQANFPFGYLLEGYEVHVYDGGREVASNVAPKRRVLTFDQAFEYVKNKYIETHQSGAFPAVPVMGNLPRDFAAQVATGKYTAAVYVKVSQEGLAQAVFSDAACQSGVDDPFVNTVVRAIRFEPALEAGKPVKGLVTLNLDKLRM